MFRALARLAAIPHAQLDRDTRRPKVTKSQMAVGGGGGGGVTTVLKGRNRLIAALPIFRLHGNNRRSIQIAPTALFEGRSSAAAAQAQATEYGIQRAPRQLYQ